MITNKNALQYSESIYERFLQESAPILEALNLTHFIYINILNPQKRLYLSNDHNWIKQYIKQALHEDYKHEKAAIIPGIRSRYAFWNSYETDKVFNACHAFGMWNGFIIYDGTEIFSFATKRENDNVANFYLKNSGLLERFIIYFKNRCKDILDPSDEDKLIISNASRPLIPEVSKVNQKNYRFLAHTKIERFSIMSTKEVPQEDQFLRYREAEALYFLSRGKTMKEAAFAMDVSPRTIEKYLENAKLRLSCFSKSELLEVFLRNRIDHYFLDASNILGF